MRKINYAQLYKQARLLLLAILFLATAALALIIFAFTGKQNNLKVISGFNYYREPIVAKVLDKEFKLETFDYYSFTTEYAGDLKVQWFNQKGEQLGEVQYSLEAKPAIVIDYFSKDKELKLCFIDIDTSWHYYGKYTRDFKGVILVAGEATTGILHETANPITDYVYPGSYAGQNLPKELRGDQSVRGVYPIECEFVGEWDKIVENVRWWSVYNPAQQRELLQKELDKIKQTPEYKL